MRLGLYVLCYNQARYIDDFVTALRPQRHLFDEVLFVDNCSSDNSAELFRATGLGEVVRRGDRSVAASNNEAMRRLTTDWVAISAVDDRYKPDAAAGMRQCIARAPMRTAMIFTGSDNIDDEGRPLPGGARVPWRVWHPPVRGLLQLAGVISPCQIGGIYRRDAYLSVMARPEEWVEDYGISVRMALRYPIVESGQVWSEYRRTPQAFSADTRPLETASATTRHRIVHETWNGKCTAKRFAQSLAAYATARSALGQRDYPRALRFSLESIRLMPMFPIGVHTAARVAHRLLA